MGYTTDFSGKFKLNKPLTEAQAAYLRQFQQTRRVKRDAAITEKRPDPLRIAVGLPVGIEGGYFVGEGGDYGQGEEPPENYWEKYPNDLQKARDEYERYYRETLGILNRNATPEGQPSLWNQWTPGKDEQDNDCIEWDGGEKFYDYVEWLKYLIDELLKPWGYVLNGEVNWEGESRDDMGIIICKDNVVTTKTAVITYEED